MSFVGREGGDHVLDLLEPDLSQFGTGSVLLHLVHFCIEFFPTNPKGAAVVAAALTLLLDDITWREPEDHWNEAELKRDEVAEFWVWFEAVLELLRNDPLVGCDLGLLVTSDGYEGVVLGATGHEVPRRTHRPG